MGPSRERSCRPFILVANMRLPTVDTQKTRTRGRRTDERTQGTGIRPAAGSTPAAAARDHRPARIPHAQPGCRPRPGRRRGRGEERHRIGLRRRPPADADVLSVDPGPSSRHPGGEREVPRHQLPDRAGRGLRHRALRRRGQEQGKHLGRLCRPDAVRRNVGDDQGRRHRAVGQLHPEGRDRRHHPLDPRGVHDRRQALWLAVPARRDRNRLAFGPDEQGRPGRCGARDLGRLPGRRQEDRRFQGRALGRHVRFAWLALAGADHAQHEHQGLHVRRACSTSPANPRSRR